MSIINTDTIHCVKNKRTILEAKNLEVSRGGVTVLDIEQLLINEGEIFTLIGPNGAGKTTLLVTLCSLAKSFQGSIFFKGRRVGEELSVNEYRRSIAMVFQEALLFNTTVFKNVASGLHYRGVKKSTIKRVVDENLERLGIAHLRDRSARALSGGEAQRVSLARAFVLNPDILFLDEPFSALDPPTRESLVSDFEAILMESKATAIFATHDRMEALRLADRIAVMSNGKILQTGEPEDIMSRPADEFVAAFVGVETILRGKVLKEREGTLTILVASGDEVEAVGSAVPGEHVTLCIRPEQVTLSMDQPYARTSARNVFRGIIEKITFLGLYYRVDINSGFPITAYVTKFSLDNMALHTGKEINASFKATAIHVLRAKN